MFKEKTQSWRWINIAIYIDSKCKYVSCFSCSPIKIMEIIDTVNCLQIKPFTFVISLLLQFTSRFMQFNLDFDSVNSSGLEYIVCVYMF